MSQKPTNLYVYLGRRDKSGVRFVAKLQGQDMLPTRLESVESLNLPVSVTNQINQIVYESRMLWEPWIESSDQFEDLRAKLRLRGFFNIPLSSQPEISFTYSTNLINLPKKTTMIRKR